MIPNMDMDHICFEKKSRKIIIQLWSFYHEKADSNRKPWLIGKYNLLKEGKGSRY